MPPCADGGTRRPLSELLRIYRKNCNSTYSEHTKLSQYVYVSNYNELSLVEYCQVRRLYCQTYHTTMSCTNCSTMIQVSRYIIDHGLCPIKSVFETFFPGVTYNVTNAKRLLQMPLAAICINEPNSGKSKIYIMEFFKGVDYVKIRHFINMCVTNQSGSERISFSKDHLHQVLSLAQCDHERELIKYTAFQASGLTPTGANRRFGFQGMCERTKKVEQCIMDTRRICECVDDLSKAQDKAVVRSFGLVTSDSDSSDSDCDFNDLECCSQQDVDASTITIPSEDFLFQSLLPDYNWFQIVDRAMVNNDDNEKEVIKLLELFYTSCMESSGINAGGKTLLKLSHDAFISDWEVRRPDAEREAEALNGMIVSDAEYDDPECYSGVVDLTESKIQDLIKRKTRSVHRRNRYLKHKLIAQQEFFKRRVPKKTSVLDKFPDIGKAIEDYVQECNVGADAWRRTGVLTFDGNTEVKSKVTY